MEEKEQAVQEQQDILMDKYVAKQNRNKKITISFILAITLILVAAIMFLALFKVSIRPPFIMEAQPRSIEVVIGTNKSPTPYSSDSKKYEQILDAYDEAFAMSYLTAMFSGQNGNYDNKIEDVTTFNSANITATNYLNCQNYMHVIFDENHYVKTSNGENYQSRSLGDLTFKEYYMALPEENKLQDIMFVFPVTNTQNDKTYMVRLPVKANVYALYTTVNDMLK